MSKTPDHIKSEVEAMRLAILTGVPVRRPPRVKKAPVVRAGVSRPRPPKYDRNKAKALFEQGLTLPQIAKEMGCHRNTVSTMLNDVGIRPRDTRIGRPRSPFCQRGLHDMSIHGREIKAGGRYCKACRDKSIKERAS